MTKATKYLNKADFRCQTIAEQYVELACKKLNEGKESQAKFYMRKSVIIANLEKQRITNLNN